MTNKFNSFTPSEILSILAHVDRLRSEGMSIKAAAESLGLTAAVLYGYKSKLNAGEFDGHYPAAELPKINRNPNIGRPTQKRKKRTDSEASPSTDHQEQQIVALVREAQLLTEENELLKKLVIDKEMKILALVERLKKMKVNL